MSFRYTVTDPAGTEHVAETRPALDALVANLEAIFGSDAEFEYRADCVGDGPVHIGEILKPLIADIEAAQGRTAAR